MHDDIPVLTCAEVQQPAQSGSPVTRGRSLGAVEPPGWSTSLGCDACVYCPAGHVGAHVRTHPHCVVTQPVVQHTVLCSKARVLSGGALLYAAHPGCN